MANPTTRRSFLSASVAATAALTTLPTLAQSDQKRYPIIAFSKWIFSWMALAIWQLRTSLRARTTSSTSPSRAART